LNAPLSTDLLLLLEALWQTRSLSEAARSCGVSLATAVRLMAQARERFRDSLFTRSGRGMLPTPAMVRAMPRIRLILENLRELETPAAFDPAKIDSDLTIACVDNAVFALVDAAARRVAANAPRLRVRFRPIDEHFPEKLRDGLLDMALYAPPDMPSGRGFRHEDLFSTEHVLVVRRGHPLVELAEAQGGIAPGDLASWRSIDLPYRGSAAQEGAASARVPGSETGLEMPYFMTVPPVLAATDLIVRLPLFTARMFCRHFPLEIVKGSEKLFPVWTLKLIWHERTDADPAQAWARTAIATLMRRHFGTMISAKG
jgi:DNA-binding transcriptional LysR family regulator